MFSKHKDAVPKRAREHLASIAQEMQVSATGRDKISSHKTIKELLVELVGLIQSSRFERRRDGWVAKLQETSALVVFGLLCIGTMLAASSSRSDIEWLEDNRVFLRTLSVGMSVVYIGVAIERMGIVAMIWRYNVAKFIVSLAVSVLVVYSAGRASSIINSIFGIDAGAFPYSRAMLAGWIAFSMAAKPLLLLGGLFAAAHACSIVMWIVQRHVPAFADSEQPDFSWPSVLLVLLSIIVLGNAYGWFYQSLAEEQLPTKVYQLARTLDFNSRHACTNLAGKVTVIYIGPDQHQVLVDERLDPVLTFGEFVNFPVHEWDRPPENFKVQECLMVRPETRIQNQG